MFVKYARAIGNKSERERLRANYLARNTFTVIGSALALGCIVAAYFVSYAEDVPFLSALAIVLTLFVGIIALIVALVLEFVFKSRFGKVLRRGTTGESDAVAAYREKFLEEQKAARKAMIVPTIIFLVFAVCGILLLLCGIMTEDEETPISFFSLGLMIFVFGALVLFLCTYFWQLRRATDGKSFLQCAADDIAVIDAEQGRAYKYKLTEDKNAQKLDYLFPNESFRKQVEELRKKLTTNIIVAAVIGLIIFGIIYFLLFSGRFFGFESRSGYFMPLMLAIVSLAIFSGAVKVYRKVSAIEKMQYEELKTAVEHETNLRLIELYKRYDKILVVYMLSFLVLSFAVAIVLAIVFPDSMWSYFAMLPLFIMLLANVKIMTKLRRQAKPIEDEIDALNAVNANCAPTEDEREEREE